MSEEVQFHIWLAFWVVVFLALVIYADETDL